MINANGIRRILSTLFISIMFLLAGTNVNAASCKGKSKAACTSASTCAWVDGYKRKDGVKVSSHCRSKTAKGKSSKPKKKKDSTHNKQNKAKKATANKSKSKKKTDKKVKSKNSKKKSKKKSSKKDGKKRQ